MIQSFVSAITPLACLFAIVAIAWTSDQVVFDEPDPSPLYEKTLEKAYSRFKQSDIDVPRGRKSLEEAQLKSFESAAVGASSDRVVGTETSEYQEAKKFEAAGDHQSAIKTLRKLKNTQRLSDGVTVDHKIGDLLRLDGEHQQAIKTYREILQEDPNHVCCFEHIGDIYRDLDESEMAERMYENTEDGYRRLIRRSGEASRPYRVQLVQFFVDHQRQSEAALDMAKDLVREKEDDPHSLLLLARSLDQNQRTREALDLVNRTLALEPDWSSSLDSYRSSLKERMSAEAGSK